MNKKDRLLATIKGESCDRPPVSAWGHSFVEEWYPTRLAEVTVLQQEQFDWDFVKLQNRATCFAEALGADFKPHPDGNSHPITRRDLIQTGDELDGVIERAESLELAPELEEQIELVATVREALGPSVPVVQSVFSPISIMGYLTGGNALGGDQISALALLRSHPTRTAQALTVITGMVQRFVERSIEAGASGIYYAVIGYGSKSLLSAEEYQIHFAAHDNAVLEAASAGWLNIAHLCGAELNFSELSGINAHALSWSVHDKGNPSLHDARAITQKALISGLHRYQPIRDGEAGGVRESARDVLRDYSASGLILAPGCSVSPWPVERPANLLALRESVGA